MYVYVSTMRYYLQHNYTSYEIITSRVFLLKFACCSINMTTTLWHRPWILNICTEPQPKRYVWFNAINTQWNYTQIGGGLNHSQKGPMAKNSMGDSPKGDMTHHPVAGWYKQPVSTPQGVAVPFSPLTHTWYNAMYMYQMQDMPKIYMYIYLSSYYTSCTRYIYTLLLCYPFLPPHHPMQVYTCS